MIKVSFLRTFVLTISMLLLAYNLSTAQDKPDTTHHQHKMHMHDSSSTHEIMHVENENSIIREGVIDLNAIDKNKDGKVFQDMMDWNVISDKPGQCPICEMKLKEVPINEAKFNLVKNGFKVK
jgi:Cu(I)/Ag(I) efflux system membrane fusion protein/cobalt-zinc-cadmium efflux system membrane fusion protein